MSINSEIQQIINKNYNISNLEDFAKIYCLDNTYEEESVFRNFKYIESREDHCVSILRLQEIKPKITLKLLEKSYGLEKNDHIEKNSVEFFTYLFYKKFLSISNSNEYNHLNKLEMIFTIDMVKRNVGITKQKLKTTTFGSIIYYEEEKEGEKICIFEFIKNKNSSIDVRKETLLNFEYDSDVDKIKPFGISIKSYFTNKLGVVDDEETIRVNQKKLEISKMTHLPKEERTLLEKEVKLNKATFKSCRISIKTSKIKFLQKKEFKINEIMNKIHKNLLEFQSINIIPLMEENEVKNEDYNDNEDGDNDNEDGDNDNEDGDSKNEDEDGDSKNEEEDNEDNDDEFLGI